MLHNPLLLTSRVVSALTVRILAPVLLAAFSLLASPTARAQTCGSMQDLDTLGGTDSQGFAVSADGSVVVGGSLTGGGQGRAFRWVVCEPCPADFNADGFVDDSDFVLFAAAYEAFNCP